jgi:hypothetical protein
MKPTLISLLLILLLHCGAPRNLFAQDPAGQDDEVIRVETDLTNLFFTATNKQKLFITTLREEDLKVVEDGVPQKNSHLSARNGSTTFDRFSDRRQHFRGTHLPQEKGAARTFIERVIQSSKDQAAIIPFTGAAYLEQGLTRDVFSIYRALERTEVALPAYLGAGRPISGIASGPGMKAPGDEGSTAIWDAIALTSSEVLARSSDPKVAAQPQGRQGVGRGSKAKGFRSQPKTHARSYCLRTGATPPAGFHEVRQSIARWTPRRSSTQLESAIKSMVEWIVTNLTQ